MIMLRAVLGFDQVTSGRVNVRCSKTAVHQHGQQFAHPNQRGRGSRTSGGFAAHYLQRCPQALRRWSGAFKGC